MAVLTYPTYVFLNRGNHEDIMVNERLVFIINLTIYYMPFSVRQKIIFDLKIFKFVFQFLSVPDYSSRKENICVTWAVLKVSCN